MLSSTRPWECPWAAGSVAMSTRRPAARPSPAGARRFVRPTLDLGGPPGEGVVLVVGRHLRAVGQPGDADEEDQSAGDSHQCLGRQAFRSDRPLLVQLARQRVRRILPHLDRPAGAERPAAGPRRDPRRPAPGEPASVRRPRDAQRRERVGRVLPEAQRPAHRLQLELEARVRGVVVRQSRAQAVMAGRAPLAQLGDRGVRGHRRRFAGHELLVAPARGDLVGAPRSAGEQAGGRGHAGKATRSRRLRPPAGRASPSGRRSHASESRSPHTSRQPLRRRASRDQSRVRASTSTVPPPSSPSSARTM